ncbi:MAG: hypothetical protein ABSC94_31050 [Polyangiaceae bacterium]|jgi:hypothetical protein
MSIGRYLLLEIIDAAEGDPILVERVRRVLGLERAEEVKDPSTAYLGAAEYARHISLSERTVWDLVSRGLPTVGAGKARRIDVARADEWLRRKRGELEGAIEARARLAARQTAGKTSR